MALILAELSFLAISQVASCAKKDRWILQKMPNAPSTSYLLPGSEVIPPVFHQLVVFFIQMLQLLRLVLHQQMTLFILQHRTRERVTTRPTRPE